MSVFRVPAVLAVLTLLGLFAALLGEAAAWRWIAWLSLGGPLLVTAWKLLAALLRLRAAMVERNMHE